MLQNPCLKRLLLCSKCTVYLKYLHKYYMVEVIFFPTLKYTVFARIFPLNAIFTLFFLYIFFLWKNTLFLSFYISSYIKIHCFLLGYLVISFHNLGETPHHEAAVNGHSNESTCILNHLKSVHFWLTHINLFNKKIASS